jgi:hypothetical protein
MIHSAFSLFSLIQRRFQVDAARSNLALGVSSDRYQLGLEPGYALDH